MFDGSFLEFREKINTVIVGRRCCFTTMKLGTYRMPRPELLYGFFAIKSEWNLNCESIVDYITYGGNSGLGSMELNTLGKKHQDNCQLICIMPVSHACRSVSLLVLPWAFLVLPWGICYFRDSCGPPYLRDTCGTCTQRAFAQERERERETGLRQFLNQLHLK